MQYVELRLRLSRNLVKEVTVMMDGYGMMSGGGGMFFMLLYWLLITAFLLLGIAAFVKYLRS